MIPRILAAIFCCWVLACAVTQAEWPGRSKRPFSFEPDPTATSEARLEGQTWRIENAGWTIDLQQVDTAQRLAFFERFVEHPIDPFAPTGDGPPPFHSFLIQVANRSESQLVFQAQNSRMVTGGKDVEYPMGVDRLQTALRMAGRPESEAFEPLRRALLDGAITLNPGDVASGMLVYRTAPARTRRFVIDLQLTTTTGEVNRVSLPYGRVKRPRGEER